MDTTLYLEAFGQRVPDTAAVDVAEEGFHSVFRARSKLIDELVHSVGNTSSAALGYA